MGHYYRVGAIAAMAAQATIAPVIPAQGAPVKVPFKTGVAIIQTLHESQKADRESVVKLTDVSPKGVEYRWQFVDVWNDGDTIRDSARTFVAAADLTHAARWRDFFQKG